MNTPNRRRRPALAVAASLALSAALSAAPAVHPTWPTPEAPAAAARATTAPARPTTEPATRGTPGTGATSAIPDAGRRETRTCDFRTTPPPAVDTSEVPAPGSPTPEPLPVPATPAGGPRMAECDIAAPAAFEVPDDVAASSWIVFDATTGAVIAAKDPHGRYRPASIIKVLLALVAIDELPMDRTLTATYDDAAMEGSRAGILEGVDYSVEKLLLGLLLSSGNDAGSVLSGALGGRDEALRKVNRKARELGATDTRIADVTGLDGPGQSTSAFDLALFYSAAFRDDEYRRLSATRLTDMPGDEDADIDGFTMSNDNQLLSSGFDGALGGKTGFTDDARHTFAGMAERDGRRLGAIVLDTTVDEGPRAWQQAAALLEAGFTTPPATSIANLATPADGPGSGVGEDDMEDEVLDAGAADDADAAGSTGSSSGGAADSAMSAVSGVWESAKSWAGWTSGGTWKTAAVLAIAGGLLIAIGSWAFRRPGQRREQGREQGREQRREKGREQGRRHGREQGREQQRRHGR